MKNNSYSLIAMLMVQFLLALSVSAQSTKPLQPDLLQLLESKQIKVVNRNISKLQDSKYKGVHLDEKENDGLAWIGNTEFTNGVIECDIRGKDVLQQSFVGIAFNGQNDETYEGIYFRPFNFKSSDAARKSHAVQYIFHPQYTWKKLRADSPDVYESSVEPAPDPNSWFHVRIEVEPSTVRVFVNNEETPSLQVARLTNPQGRKIGFWVGNTSAGDFANLTITPGKL